MTLSLQMYSIFVYHPEILVTQDSKTAGCICFWDNRDPFTLPWDTAKQGSRSSIYDEGAGSESQHGFALLLYIQVTTTLRTLTPVYLIDIVVAIDIFVYGGKF